MTNELQMPQYVSHKKVRALELFSVEIDNDTGDVELTPVNSDYPTFRAPTGWILRYHGSDSDTGYYIQYEDGYTSWSPTKAFEEGYTFESAISPAPASE